MLVLVAGACACVCGGLALWLLGLCLFSCWLGVGLDRLHRFVLLDVGAALGNKLLPFVLCWSVFFSGCLLGQSSHSPMAFLILCIFVCVWLGQGRENR